ncbi:MAG TPA: plastocyanin/azurin family copper-binding protein [Acidimicrobiales bacterium]
MSKLLILAVLTASATTLAADGTIAGKVDVTPAKYLEETVVYLKGVKGPARAPETKTMDQKAMVFLPHVMVITQGDTVKFLNHDNVVHNVYTPDNEGYNLGSFKQEEDRSYTFKQEGVYTQLCSMHPEMLAFIFVAPSPYAAVVDKKGSFTIPHVPPGTYQLAVWNSHLKAPDKPVTVAAGQTLTETLTLKR